jgi:DNA-binding GntR family transcriptional regulator
MKQISALYSLIEAPMRLWLQHSEKPLSARQEHAVILDAIRSGDVDRAEAIVREHIEGTVPALIQFLQSEK